MKKEKSAWKESSIVAQFCVRFNLLIMEEKLKYLTRRSLVKTFNNMFPSLLY